MVARQIFVFELVNEAGLDPDSEQTILHPSEVELGETTREVMKQVDALRPSRVVFDSLSEMRLLAQNPLRYRRQILALKQFFSSRECTVLMLDDRTWDPSDLQLHSIAHGVISLEQRPRDFGAERRRQDTFQFSRATEGQDLGWQRIGQLRGHPFFIEQPAARRAGLKTDRIVVCHVVALPGMNTAFSVRYSICSWEESSRGEVSYWQIVL